ncbi:porin family protein [Flavobacterium sp.]|uniref:porin family protein n=1 Tax=Flavobacterium sp. TaxID=239 RepID=UPI001216E978|nr:porin family protein [Flavobacterium sp.]RZJ68974.1 MAG: PorT family protein [Flavobacterium sp.]
MTKIILCAAAFAVSAFSAQAQDKKLEFGVKAGANLTTFTGDFEDAEVKPGFHAGGIANYHFNESFGLQAEVLYSLQGAKSGYEETDFGTTFKNVRVNLSYINVPVLAKYELKNVRGLSFGFGPQVGVLVSAKQKFDAVSGGSTSEESEDIKDQLKTVDFSVIGDVEYKLASNIFFSVRGQLGVSNVNDVGNDKVHNAGLSLSGGYRF